MKTKILVVLGHIFLVMGAIGLVLPVWPTTPFVLLALACLSRSPRIRAKVMKIQFIREHIENFESKKGMSKKTYWTSIVWLWGSLIISFFFTKKTWLNVLLFLICFGVTCSLTWMSRDRRRN